MARLTRDELFRRRSVSAEIPEYGQIGIRLLTLAEIEDWREKTKANSEEGARHLLAISLCDEEGALLFDLNDLSPLDGLDFPTFKAILDAIIEANGLNARVVKPTTEQLTRETADAVKN